MMVDFCLIYISFLITYINIINEINSKPCGIDFLKIPKRTLLKQEGENRRMLKENDWENLRIHMDYSFIENNIGNFDKKDLIDLKEKIMPKTQEVFQKLLKVKRIQNKLKLNTQSCDNYQIPEIYQSEGVDADLIIFVLIDDTGFFLQNKIEAGAIHCLQHQETRRPIAGYIQFKPQLNVNNSTALDYMVWLAVHEVSHILVINNALYEDYIHPETLEPIGIDKVIGKKIMESGNKMNFIKSPKVLENAKKHFGCDHLDGVPLEYNGGAGTAGAHWAKKYMNTDYMIGDSYGENLISEITLGLFEDSGWYRVDYQMGNLFLWGKNVGCGFFEKGKKCIENSERIASIPIDSSDDKNKSIRVFADIVNKGKHSSGYLTEYKNEFCTNFNYPICSASNIFRGICKLRKFPFKLSKSERYFNNPQLGGADTLTDKCPIAIEDKGDQSYYGGSCRVGNKETLMMKDIEKICPECACFMSNLSDGNIKQRINDMKNISLNKLNILNTNTKNSDKHDIKIMSKNNMRKNNDQKTLEINKDQQLFEKSEITKKTNIRIEIDQTALVAKNDSDLDKELEKKFFFKQEERVDTAKTNSDENIIDDPILTDNDYIASCFEYKCEKEKLYVLIKNEKYRCRSGDLITIHGYSGGIFCPENENLCDVRFNCKFGCVDRYSNKDTFFEYPKN